MRKSLPEKDQRWKDVPGTGGKYQANPEGQVCRFTKNGKRMITEGYVFQKKTTNAVYVKLSVEGKEYTLKMSHVIWATFKGQIPEGYSIVHADGMITNNQLTNLMLMTKKETGIRYGWRCSKRANNRT